MRQQAGLACAGKRPQKKNPLGPSIIVRGPNNEYGGPGRDFDGPGGGFNGNRTSGKPLLLLKFKNLPQEHQNHDQDNPRARY